MTFADLDKKARKVMEKAQGASDAVFQKGEEIGKATQRITGQARERRARESTRK